MSLYSTLSSARTGTTSLRATIPEGIVAFLGVKEGDKLDWKMEVSKDGERIVIVTKSEDDLESARRIARKYSKK
jgi:bifunctional DNA-binding transcriptional regulator/antitoxin component of YhaV-PrlF toxin-antitoxin module